VSDKISLNRTQLTFITEWLEEPSPERAVKKFAEILIEERCDPLDISEIINKIMARMKK
jgi:hypothetical protein